MVNRAVPRDVEGAAEPAGVHQPGAVAGSDGGIYRVLQSTPVPRRNRQCDACRCVRLAVGADPEAKGGTKTADS